MSPRALKIWLGSTLVLAVAAAPFLARGDQSTSLRKQQYASQISKLSDSQRARLLQNEQQYKAASTQEKSSFEALHQALEKDRLAGSELTTIMQHYDAWLKTIEPYQREQLDETHDPKERIALMQEIVRSQRERTASRNMPFGGPGRDRPHWDRTPTLDEKSLAAVMQAMRQGADKRLTADQRQELDGLQGLKRDYRLLQILKEGNGVNSKPLLDEPPVEFKKIAEEIDKYVDDDRVRSFIHFKQPHVDGQPDWNPSPESRLARVISRSLLVELFKQRRLSHQPTEVAKLQTFLESLPAEHQYELLALEASEFQMDLKNLYFDSEGLKDLPSTEDIGKLFGRGGMRGGPGGGPDRGPFGFGSFRDNRSMRGEDGGRPDRRGDGEAPAR